MIDAIRKARAGEDGILCVGMHPAIVQSILDFDFLSGKPKPSVIAILTGGRKAQKFFFGHDEVLVPCYPHAAALPDILKNRIRWLLNVQSGRRAATSTETFFELFPDALGGMIFAENVPEKHASDLIRRFGGEKLLAGPASVGLLVSGALKLGAIGGIDPGQIEKGKLHARGNIAVGSTSGGMTNELMRAVTDSGKCLSFAVAVGGDRFPVLSLTDFFLAAEADAETDAVVYFGELGGQDEYELVELIRSKRFTKPIVAYIAGVIDEAFEEHVQFGHAKALVRQKDESARAKREALRSAGATVPETFPEFLAALSKLPERSFGDTVPDIEPLMNRTKSILSTREFGDSSRVPVFVKNGALVKREGSAFVRQALEALIGKPVRSDVTLGFADGVFALLMDHGGQVSGAVNTMITARAGKDLVSSLTAGLLTIGPRFGGAVNDAARTWHEGALSKANADEFVEGKTEKGGRIPGIGHRKYRVGLPDPRVEAIAAFSTLLKTHPHYDFARSVEAVTTSKNGSLILNVDGAIAALLLDILTECEGLSKEEISELLDAEFFNAFFVIPRSVGFIAHFMEQKRNDEGLFRLPDELLFVRKKDQESSES